VAEKITSTSILHIFVSNTCRLLIAGDSVYVFLGSGLQLAFVRTAPIDDHSMGLTLVGDINE